MAPAAVQHENTHSHSFGTEIANGKHQNPLHLVNTVPSRKEQGNHDFVIAEFSMDQKESEALTSSSCNGPLETEPVELVVAAAIDAFKIIFSDMRLPKILCEANTDTDDLIGGTSRKVYPLTLHQVTKAGNGYRMEEDLGMGERGSGKKEEFVSDEQDELKDTIMVVKNAYRRDRAEEWKSSQYAEQSITMLFRPFNSDGNELGGNDLPRKSHKLPLTKLEIAPVLEQGLLCIKVKYLAANKRMQENIVHWIAALQRSLRSVMHLTQILEQSFLHPKLQDYPLLQIHTEAELETVMEGCRAQLQVRQLAEIEDIFPCTPMQEGMLVAQSKAAHLYKIRATREVKSKYGTTASLDLSALHEGWHEVVQRHQMLRTVFVQARVGKRSYLQVALKSSMPGISPFSVVAYETESQMMKDDEQIQLPDLDRPQHHFRICQIGKSGRVFCRLYLNHAVMDGFSASIFFRDLMQALDGTLAYQAPAETYKSFVRYLSQQDHHASLSFWNDLLSGASACKFPSFSSGYLGAPKVLRRHVAWTATQTSTIRRVCKHMGISPASFFRSIWALVLQCYTGSDDVCFGTMSSGRLIPVTGSIGIVGPMIANVTCRAQMTASMSIETLFKTMMKDYGRSLPFQHCSVAEITHSQGLGGEPLFNTVVNFMAGNAKDDVLETALCTFEYIESSDPADYDIILEILDDSTNMTMSFNSWRSFLREDEADCIIGTFSQAIASVVADPAQAVGGLSIFSPEDTSKVQAWSTCQLPDISSTIHEQVSRQAASSPGKMAVCSTSLNLTYEELESLSDRLARVLVGSGVGKGAVVPFCMEKSVWATVAMLGVVKAGAAFVPLEPAHPLARLEWLIEELKADFVLCSREALGKVKGLFQNRSDAHKRLEVIVVEDVTSRVPSITTLLPSTKGSDTAYIIFTSGSTGTPKGVVVTHQAACGSIAQCAQAFRIDSKSRVLQFSAYTWDAILCEIFSTLDCGGTIFVPNEVERIDGLVQFLKKNELNWLFLTPTVLRLIDPEQVHQKLTIVTIGELLGQDLIDSWHSKAVLINAYGPTESCVACVSGVVEKGASSHFIGKPFGSRAWVVLADDHNRLSPLGSIGELLIEGPNLAQGYFNDKQKTAMSFPSYPRWATQFGLEASSRFYKTGDLVRQNIDDGSLIFITRKDAQIKINGQRVELGEVEHHLLNSERTCIRDAITLVPNDGPWKSKLVAVLSLPDHGNSTSSTSKNSIPLISPSLHNNNVAKEIFRCRRRLEDNLPAYMVPTFWVPLTQLPVLDSGKIDRSQISRWLCEPDENSEEQIQAWVASIGTPDEDQKQPMTLAQVKLRRIWAHVLHLPEVKVSIDKSFLNLGGDSIMAVTVATQSRAAGIAVTVQDLLRRKTIEELVSSAEIDAAEVQEHHKEQASELSPTQALYVAADQAQIVHPGLLINLIRPVNNEVVLAAVKILVGRHPMLLARFQQDRRDNSKWMQRIADDVQDSWIFNVRQLDSVEDIQMVYASSQSDVVVQPGPVLSVNLIHIQCKPPSTYILLTANALIVDVESWRIIFDDLEDILRTGAPQQPASMPFRDWINQQATMPVASLPTEPTSQHWGLEAGYQNELALVGFSISQEETEALMTSCNDWLRTEPSDLIIAAVIYAFELVFTDRSLPMVFSERDVRQAPNGDVDIARTVGLFTKIFPVALQPAEQQHESVSSSLKETLMKVKDSVLTARRANWSLQATSSDHKPMDIIFRPFSTLQRLGGDESILEATVMTGHRPTASLAVFEISPSLERGSLVIKLSYPACIPMQEEISKWMEHCKDSVEETIRLTRTLIPQPTLQSYPLLRLTSYIELDKVTKACQLQLSLRQLAEIEDIYPCSPMQEGILLAEAKTSLSIYDQRLTWKIKNRDVDLCKLQDAWQALVDRHTMLRTVFIEYPLQDYHAAQVVLGELKANVSVIKCKDVEELQMIQAHRPEVQSKVLHDLVICETQSGEFYCVLSFNHLLGDATSLQIIVQELQLVYGGHPESATPSSYGDFISYLSRQDSKEVYRYWETFLAGVDACAFQKLTDVEHNNAHPESSSISQLSINLTTRQISELRRLSTESDITIAMVSNTIWAVILHTFLSREDVCFGYLASGRDIDLPGVESMLGPLVTLLVCSLNIRPTMRLLDLARAVQDNYAQSLSAQHYSLAEVYHSLGLQGEQLFNTVINVIPTQASLAPAGGKQYTDQSLDMVPVEIINPSEFDIALDVIYSDSEAKVVLNYQREYLSESLASSVIATISRILDALLENPELQVGQLKLCDELQQQSMSTWEPSDDIESRICLHESIEQRTKENPNAEAVCAHDGDFSYSDVWALSNQLAHRLVDLGVGPNICVSVNMASVFSYLSFYKPCMPSI
jgi:amino acid adenylation domain-containing protein